MNKILFSVMLTLLVSQVVPLPEWIGQNAYAQDFDAGDVNGTYGFSFEGTAISPNDGTSVPFVATGLMVADGVKNISSVRTINYGGLVLQQTGNGTYIVNPNGTGSATFNMQTNSPPAQEIPPGIPSATRETFSFVSVGDVGEEALFIGTAAIDTTTQQPLQGVIRGVVIKQEQPES